MSLSLSKKHTLIFRRFSPEYCQQLCSWFTTQQQILFWSGDKFGSPTTLSEFATQLRLVSIPAYAIISQSDNSLLAFGQLMSDKERCHMVRLAVNPELRGKGYGKMLLNCLFLEGQKQYQPRYFSLFVNQENHRAIKLYRKVGFCPTQYPGTMPNDFSWYMEKRVV